MKPAHSQIIEQLSNSPTVAIEFINGRDGAWGLAMCDGERFFFIPYSSEDWSEVTGSVLSLKGELTCWDTRKLVGFEMTDNKVIWDIRSLHNGESTLVDLCRKRADNDNIYARYVELDAKMVAHARAAKTARIEGIAAKVAPVELIRDWVKLRVRVIRQLFLSPGPHSILNEYERRWPFIRALRQVELACIHIDTAYVNQALSDGPEPATRKALQSMADTNRDGFVMTLLNPMGGKTGRLRHEGGFNSLAIPKGPARRAITSRFDGGLIYTIDFNAIDYRCIVRHIGGETAKLYEGATDFHERTASFVFKTVTPAARDAIKYLSYIYIYGGSEETLVAKTGWTLEQVRKVLALLDSKIAPIKEFRARLWMQSQEQGYVDTPGGRRVATLGDDGDGKVVGLFAQTYSSHVFEEAFKKVQSVLRDCQSKLVFSVHDELVIDCHPDEIGVVEGLKSIIETDGFVVKMKKGRSYGEVE